MFSSPIQVSSLTSVKVVGVACGNNFTLAYTSDGVVYSWGCGRHGVLGHGDIDDRLSPSKLETDFGGGGVVQCSAGFAHCSIITADHRVFMFGKGKDGALGLGAKHRANQLTPQELCALSKAEITNISCSVGEHHGHTLAASKDGRVFAWGDGYKGKLGLGLQESQFLPVQIPAEYFNQETIVGVSAGGIHSAALSLEGHVYTWGCGSDGRLGHPEAKGHRYLFRSDIPRLVERLQAGKATGLAASYYHTVAIINMGGEKAE